MPRVAKEASAFRVLLRSFQCSRSSTTRARRFERRRCGRESCRECQFHAALAQQQRRPAQNGKVEGANPSRGTSLRFELRLGEPFAHVVQCRDGALKTRKVPVQTRSWALVAVRKDRVWPNEDAFRSRRKGCRCKSCHTDQFGMSTGQASRASVLTSACLRASGASPRHSDFCRRPAFAGGHHARVAQREPAGLYPASH